MNTFCDLLRWFLIMMHSNTAWINNSIIYFEYNNPPFKANERRKKTDKQKPLNVPFLFWMYFEYIASRRKQCKFCHFWFEKMQTQKIVWWMAPNVTWRKCRALVQNSQVGEIEFGNYIMFETQENAQNVINFAAENFLFTHFIYGWKDT